MTLKTYQSVTVDQYRELKKGHPNIILLFSIGTRYETYDGDAIEVAEILKLPMLISRWVGEPGEKKPDAPTVTFRRDCFEDYLHKLLKAGKRVAVCDLVAEEGR